MAKKKIVRIIARLNVGGPAINAVLLTDGLREDFGSTLVSGKIGEHEGDMSYLAREKGINPVIVKGLGREVAPVRDVKSFRKIYRLIKAERPAIVHTHTAKAGALGRLAAILLHVPVKVHTFHGHTFSGYFGPVKSKIYIWIERILACFTDRIIAVGDNVKDELCNKFRIAPNDKIEVVNLGFDLDRFLASEATSSRLRQELGIADDCYVVGIVGRLESVKNHRMFFDAIRILKDRHPTLKAKFLVVGDGQLRYNLKSYVSGLGIEKDVVFLGWRRDLDNIYAGCDLICLTSLNEGTPVSLIEAQASGKAVVATDVGGVRDVVLNGKTGILVGPGDTAGFAEAVLGLLLNEEKRRNFGLAGRERAAERFSKTRLIEDTRKLYEELLEKK